MESERKRGIRHFRDLDVYRRAFDAAMEIFELTKTSAFSLLWRKSPTSFAIDSYLLPFLGSYLPDVNTVGQSAFVISNE